MKKNKKIEEMSRRLILSKIESLSNKGRILELGCGNGLFLKIAKERGWKPIGIEPESKLDFKGLSVRKSKVEKCNFPSKFFNVIVMLNVLEHVENPHKVLRLCKKWLKNNGLLLITVPNLKRTFVKMDSDKIFHPTHLSYFTPESLEHIITLNGFKILELRSGLIKSILRKKVISHINMNDTYSDKKTLSKTSSIKARLRDLLEIIDKKVNYGHSITVYAIKGN